MVESAAHPVDHVLPEQPIPPWALTFPCPLRFLFAAQPQVLSRVLGVVYRAISTCLIKNTGITVATSQLPIDQWHAVIGDPTLADAILDRLVHNAYKINLRGESMRKRQAKLTGTARSE